MLQRSREIQSWELIRHRRGNVSIRGKQRFVVALNIGSALNQFTRQTGRGKRRNVGKICGNGIARILGRLTQQDSKLMLENFNTRLDHDQLFAGRFDKLPLTQHVCTSVLPKAKTRFHQFEALPIGLDLLLDELIL